MFDFSELTEYARSLTATKQSLLRFTAKSFDPLGLLSPFVIHLKILFQLICMNQHAWDDPLPGELHDHWQRILLELTSISKIRIPRCYFQFNCTASNVQVHGFCDTSSQAYAAVFYLCSSYPDGHVDVRLIASKTKVAPLKRPTIPRLELLGELLLSRFADVVLKSINDQPQVTYWLDSTTVLYWIKNENTYMETVYVGHSVQEIRKLTKCELWRHCPGQFNPADLPS